MEDFLENTHISSTVLAELNEVLTNLKNKTKIIVTTGATATWNKMAAYTRASIEASEQGYKILAQMTEDASAAKLLPDKKYDKIFKETRNQTDGKLQDTEMDKDDIGKKSYAEDTNSRWFSWTVSR